MFTRNSLLLAILFSLFIYLEHFGLSLKLISTITSLLVFIMIFQLSKKELFASGFMISLLWFWWIGYSFIYYELTYLIPVILVGISLIYGSLFYLIGLFKNIYYKIIYIFILSFVNPFNFNWFKLELPLIDSYLGTSKIEFLIILIISGLFIQYRQKYTKKITILYFSTILALYLFNLYNYKDIKPSPLLIYQNHTNIDQKIKWNKEYKEGIVLNNFKAIQNAIDKNYDLIVFPETVFPLILNHESNLLTQLFEYSKKIPIVLGSLYEKEQRLYNSTYIFKNNSLQVAHKVVLVPFGEAVPFPQKIKNWINDTFYNGAQDYITAANPTTFNIKGVNFRNAICYEATTDKIFQDLDTNYMIAISNNAWFTPSTQATLQKLLLKYYSNKYKVFIYSITNQ